MMLAVLAMASVSLAGVRVSEMTIPGSTLLAPRGGVLMTRLLADAPGDAWPDEIPLRLVAEDGDVRTLVGEVGWMEPLRRSERREWGDDPRALFLREVRPDDRFRPDDPLGPLAGPRLLVALPDNANGTLMLGRQALPVQWVTLPATMPAIRVGTPPTDRRLMVTTAPDLPGRVNPLDWWRWELIAERRGLQPPSPEFDSSLSQLAARHVSGLWRIAMTTLANASRGVAAQCRDLLTATCRDGDVTVAAWITDAIVIDKLLRLLLDPTLKEDTRVRAALAWADEQMNLFAWVEQPFGDLIRVGLANPGLTPRLAEYVWSGGDQVPLGVPLPPDTVVRSSIARSDVTATVPRGQIDILNILIGDRVQRLPFGDAVTGVTPPGIILGPFLPAYTLADVRAGLTPETTENQRTWMQIRQRGGAWEIYIECLLPHAAPTAFPNWADRLDSIDDLRTIEAVTIQWGWASADRSWIRHTVSITPRDGWRRHGDPTDQDPTVATRVLDDRWLATVRIPDAWLPPAGATLHLAALRTHGDRSAIETMPVPVVPWRLEVEPILLDLDLWDAGDPPRLRSAGSRR